MNKPHKWAKEIKAWADGATIQVRMVTPTAWTPWQDIPLPKWNNDDDAEYRIKPEPREWWIMSSLPQRTGDTVIMSLDGTYGGVRVREVLE